MKKILIIGISFLFSCNENRNENRTIPPPSYGGDTLGLIFSTGFENDTVSLQLGDSIIFKDVLSTQYTIGVAGSVILDDFNNKNSNDYNLNINDKRFPLSLSKTNRFYYISIDTNKTVSVDAQKHGTYVN